MMYGLYRSFVSIFIFLQIGFCPLQSHNTLSAGKPIPQQDSYPDLNKIFNNPASHIVITPHGNQQEGLIKKPLVSLYQQNYQFLRFVFIVPAYNNARWYKKNLESIFTQKYSNYHVIYIDDASTDGTGALAEALAKEWGMESRFTLIKNKERNHMAYNRYIAIHLCADTDICIALDGDDWLKNEDVLSYYNKVYQDKNVWMTYGSFTRFPSGKQGRACGQIPPSAIKQNRIRAVPWTASHLKTFYAWLFKLIKIEHFKYEESFLTGATDLAMMFPMLEMAHHYSKFISKQTCVYNCEDRQPASPLMLKMKEHRKKIGSYLKEQKPFNPIKIIAC